MMLVSIELAGPGIDLQKFDCAICNSVLESFALYEDPMKSRGLGAGFKVICTREVTYAVS
jgi:hypothetical protein